MLVTEPPGRRKGKPRDQDKSAVGYVLNMKHKAGVGLGCFEASTGYYFCLCNVSPVLLLLMMIMLMMIVILVVIMIMMMMVIMMKMKS